MTSELTEDLRAQQAVSSGDSRATVPASADGRVGNEFSNIDYVLPVAVELPTPSFRMGGRRLLESVVAVARHTGPEAVRVLRRGSSGYNPFVPRGALGVRRISARRT
jgi:hypothetical protein